MSAPSESPSAKWLRLLIVAALVLGVEVISSLITIPQVQSWYPTLTKPAWNPPDWLFGPVWTTLYALIAFAGWRVWERVEGQHRRGWSHPAMCAFAAQLFLNFFWSILFFGLHFTQVALLDIVMLLLSIGVMIRRFYPLDRLSAWLMVPYFAWVAYASTLNAGIVWLNH